MSTGQRIGLSGGLFLVLCGAIIAVCGPQPMPHIPPPNCKRVDAQCVCDDTGRSCRWEFVCVPHDR